MKKLFRRLLSVLLILVFFVITVFYCFQYVLEKNKFSYTSIDFSFPCTLNVRDFKIIKPNFKLSIGEAEIQFTWSKLFKGQLGGALLRSSRIDIVAIADTNRNETESDTSGIAWYHHVPYLYFEQVNFREINLKLHNAYGDTNQLLFPSVRFRNFTFNDSIVMDSLVYKNGNIVFSATPTELDINIPEAVPRFNITFLQVDSLDFELRKEKKRILRMDDLNLHLAGWNRAKGANLKPQKLNLKLQDTLHLDFLSEDLVLENSKFVAVHNISLGLPGLHLGIKELSATKMPQGKKIKLILDSCTIYSHLIHYLSPSLFPDGSKKERIQLAGTITSYNDTVQVKNLNLHFGKNTQAQLDGKVIREGDLSEFNLRLKAESKLQEIESLLGKSIPKELNETVVKTNLEVKGNSTQPEVAGHIKWGNEQISLRASYATKTSRLWFKVGSPFVDVGKVMQDKNLQLVCNGLSLEGNLVVNAGQPLSRIDGRIKADTIRYNSIRVSGVSFFVARNQGITSLLFQSTTRDVVAQLQTNNDLTSLDSLRLFGYAALNTTQLKDNKLQSGRVYCQLNALVKSRPGEAMLTLQSDSLTFSALGKNRVYKNTFLLKAQLQQHRYDVSFQLDSLVSFVVNTDTSVINWLKKQPIGDTLFPAFNLQARVHLPGDYLKDLTGYSAQLRLDTFQLTASRDRIQSITTIPVLVFEKNKLNNLTSNLVYTRNDKTANVQIERLFLDSVIIDSLRITSKANRDNALNNRIAAYFPSVNQGLTIGFDLAQDPKNVRFSFAAEALIVGNETWKAHGENKLLVNKENKRLRGEIGLTNRTQRVKLVAQEEVYRLHIDSMELGPLASLVEKNHAVSALLSLTFDYHPGNSDWDGKGSLQKMLADSIDLGDIHYLANHQKEATTASLKWHHALADARVDLRHSKENLSLDVNTSELNLRQMDSLFRITPSNITLEGTVKANFKYNSSKALPSTGEIVFNRLSIEDNNKALGVYSDRQSIFVTTDHIEFKAFTLRDKQNHTLVIEGLYAFNSANRSALKVKTDRFALISSNNRSADLWGEMDIAADLNVANRNGALSVQGKLKTLPNGAINYFRRGSVTLEDRDQTITFRRFEEGGPREKPRSNFSRLPVKWDVSVEIGEFDAFVLLSKNNQEFVKMKAGGNLVLTNGYGTAPAVYGEVGSTGGRVFYKPPFVSVIELDIRTATAKWLGDIGNPTITFLGTETFRPTPQQVYSGFSNSTERVPVVVSIAIEEKPVKDFKLKFDIRSDDPQIQNYFSSLAPETKESYAIDMLFFGKINSDASASKSSLDAVADKLNEISRRSFKSAELNFHVDKHGEPNDPTQISYSTLGYDFSKEFYDKRLKFTVGSNVGLGQSDNTANTHTNLLGNVELKYFISRKPSVYFSMSRTNAYRGPIEGQVDESSLAFGFSAQFYNLFRYVDTTSRKVIHNIEKFPTRK